MPTSDINKNYFFRRLFAFIYDVIIVFFLLILVSAIAVSFNHQSISAHSYFFKFVLFIVIFSYFILFSYYTQQTIGMRAWDIRYVFLNDEGKIIKLTARFLLGIVNLFVLFLLWFPFKTEDKIYSWLDYFTKINIQKY